MTIRGRFVPVAAAAVLILLSIGVVVSNPAAAPAPLFTVGVSHHGDRVEFDEYSTSGPAGIENSVTTNERRIKIIGDVETIYDQSVRKHAAVRIDDVKPSFHNGTGIGERGVWTEYYALESREIMRVDLNAGLQASGIPEESWNMTMTALWPDFGAGFGVRGNMFETLALIQGRTLTSDIPLVATFNPMHDPSRPAETLHMQQVINLGPRGTLNGVQVHAVHVELRTWYAAGSERDGAVWGNRTLWFENGAAYPIQFEERWKLRGWKDEGYALATGTTVGVRVHLERGDNPLLWGEAPFLSRRVDRAQLDTTDIGFPTGGPGWRGGFSPEQAVAAHRQDPTLVQFHVWRQQNPDNRVLGLLRNGYVNGVVAAPDQPQWSVWYGTPGSPAMRAVHSLQWADGSILNRELPAVEVDAHEVFQEEWVSPQLTTLGGLDTIWRALGGEIASSTQPNFFVWGYATHAFPTFDPRYALRNVAYGRSEPDMVAGADFWIRVDLPSGNVTGAFVVQVAPDVAGSIPFGVFGVAEVTTEAGTPPSKSSRFLPWFAAGAGASALALLLAVLYPAIHQGLVGLYARLTVPQATAHELRNRISTLIRERPGISPPALSRETGAAWSTLTYHLSVLHRNKVVLSVKQGRHRLYYAGNVPGDELRKLATLANPGTRRVFEFLRSHSGCVRSEVASSFGWTPAGALWHLERLRTAGLAAATKEGKSVRYRAVETA